MNKRIPSTMVFLLLSSISTFGQDQAAMADNLRAEGKIYVVVIMILIVLAGLIFYLFLMDKKVKRLEKLLSDKKKQTN
jgi:hypothetical protein